MKNTAETNEAESSHSFFSGSNSRGRPDNASVILREPCCLETFSGSQPIFSFAVYQLIFTILISDEFSAVEKSTPPCEQQVVVVNILHAVETHTAD